MPRPLSSRMKSVSACFMLFFIVAVFTSLIIPGLGDPRPLMLHAAPPPGYVAMWTGARMFRHHVAVRAWAAMVSNTLLFSAFGSLAIGVILVVIANRQASKER